MWYQDPLMFVMIMFVASGMVYLGYRLVKTILDHL